MKNIFSLLLLILMSACVPLGILKPPSVVEFEEQVIRAPAAEYGLQLQMGDNAYVESVLVQAFSNGSDESRGKIHTMIYQQTEFGGVCDRYAMSEIDGNPEFPREKCANSELTKANSNPGRYAYAIKACEELTTQEASFKNIMDKIFPDGKIEKVNQATFLKAYQIFYLEESPDKAVTNEFIKLSKEVGDPKEAWRVIMMTLCSSPQWQSI